MHTLNPPWQASNGHPLSALGYFLLQKTGLIRAFGLHPLRLARWLRRIEAGYSKRAPYHNATHAADVLQVCSWACLRWPAVLFPHHTTAHHTTHFDHITTRPP